ncbi:MAG: SPOR domain-containing protein, partial [Bacteroidales bacterium]|nr:SPOR domain-containing protein [Bacteroidales bacterium]
RLLGKNVEIVMEGEFYKVRILDLKDRQEVDEHIERLEELGYSIFWVIRLKAMQQQLIIKETSDSLLQVTGRDIYADRPEITTDMAIQLGAFRNEAYAKIMVEKLEFRLDKDLVIVREDGYHKVRIKGFESVEEMERIIPSLELLGIDDLWIIPPEERPADTSRAAVEPPAIAAMKDARFEAIKPDISKIKEDFKVNEPLFSLQVAVYPKRTQAMRAKRQIERKLYLPVEIVQQWDYYRVIVTGFYTREETFRYYPELAELGFDRIVLIDKGER